MFPKVDPSPPTKRIFITVQPVAGQGGPGGPCSVYTVHLSHSLAHFENLLIGEAQAEGVHAHFCCGSCSCSPAPASEITCFQLQVVKEAESVVSVEEKCISMPCLHTSECIIVSRWSRTKGR